MNERVDDGEIIAQAPVRIMNDDELPLVKQKVQAAEHISVGDQRFGTRHYTFSTMIKVHTSLNEDHLEEIENVLYDLYPHN